MSLLFETGGILTTVQDAGRNGFRRFGVSPGGAMDGRAARLISILLGNEENEGVLEMHYPAPTVLFEAAARFALGGADFSAELDESPVENWRRLFVKAGSRLRFKGRNKGARLYLAVAGGFAVESWLGSRSTNLTACVGGFHGRALQKGDRLFFRQTTNDQEQRTNYKISPDLVPNYSNAPKIRVTKGAEWEKLTAESQGNFLGGEFVVRPESDRMGFRLRGESLELIEKIELVSSAVDFGTLQLLPDGQLILLMADCQTTGGYPRAAHVINIDLPLLAQLNAGDRMSFETATIEEAENAVCDFETHLNLFRAACRFLF